MFSYNELKRFDRRKMWKCKCPLLNNNLVGSGTSPELLGCFVVPSQM